MRKYAEDIIYYKRLHNGERKKQTNRKEEDLTDTKEYFDEQTKKWMDIMQSAR